MSNERRDWQADEIHELQLRARLLEAEALVTASPYQFDRVWEKYCELESIDPDNASGISKIGASFLYTAGFSEGRHHANKRIAELEDSVKFYAIRCEELQEIQSRMRDPERQMVCDILANGKPRDKAGIGEYKALLPGGDHGVVDRLG